MTRTEQRIADLLKDRKPHPLSELRALLYDGDSSSVRVHLSRLRRYGLVIICERSLTETSYRLNLR